MALDNIWDWSVTAASNTDIAGINIAEGMQRASVNNALRELMSQARELCNQGSDIASASTTAIAATGTSFYAKVTGTTGITSFGTANAGVWRWITFTGAPTITHNATSMILPGAANFTTSAGDMIFAVSEGSGNWRVRIFPASGKPVVPSTNGKHKLFIPASALTPAAANPPAAGSFVGSSFAQNIFTYDFDQSTIETVFFCIGMPSSWDGGTITHAELWTAAAGSGDVIWLLDGAAFSNDDALDSAFGTGAGNTDTLIATGDLHRTAESSAVTITGSPAANDMVNFRLRRNASSGSDTLNADAKLIGIEIYITTNAAVDVA